MNNQAAAVWRLGHPATAARLLHLALRDTPPTELELPVSLFQNLASINRQLGNLPLARSAIREARAAWEDWPPPRTAAGQRRRCSTLGNIWNTEGNIFSDLYELAPTGPHAGRWWDQAHQAYDQARGIYLPQGLKQGIVTVSLNLGLLYALAGRWEPADQELTAGLAAAQRLRHPRLIAFGLVQQGRGAVWRRDNPAAWKIFERVLPLVEGRDDMTDLHFQTCYHLAAIARRRRTWAAVQHYERKLTQLHPKVSMLSRERHAYERRRDRDQRTEQPK